MPKIEPVEGKSAAISADIDTFIAEMTKSSTPRSSGTGRLIFALDATASRNETWDMACQLQGDMFQDVASVGGLSVQLVYYCDLSECRSSRDCPGRCLIREGGVAHLEPLGSGCRIRKGEQRHDDYYHAFIARARAQPRDGLARCGQLL